ncbi:hypothetical protein HPP92_008490 [Vanilla planifolia]|uniref:Pentatricopeptide repeat-containing protein n=1 Tax=Vanilla planifolia TaxID=51239 RepID=A0A835R851_VANPL|nr:hypothetical protein HPP92_008490 [Vanilla planifolia]
MYKYILRAAHSRHNTTQNIARGQELVLKNIHGVPSSQAISKLSTSDFNLLGRINSSAVIHAQLQIVNALRLGQRDKAKEMLTDLSCMNNPSNVKDFDYILEYCSTAPDPLFVMETWKHMVKNQVDLKKKSYGCIIQAFSKGGYFKEAFDWLYSLERSDHFHAGLPVYNRVLRECVNKRSWFDVNNCLEQMNVRLMGKSEITYCELLKHSVLQKSLTSVLDMWKDCIKYYSPSILILRKFIWSFTRLGDVESAYKVLQYMVVLVKSKCLSLKKSSTGRYHSSRFDIPIPILCNLSNETFSINSNASSQEMFSAKSTKVKGNTGILDFSHKADHSSDNIADKLLEVGDVADSCFVSNKTDMVFSEIQGTSLFHEEEELIENTADHVQNLSSQHSIPKETKSVPVVNVLRWSFNDLIQSCAAAGIWELAEILFVQMQTIGVNPSPNTYDGLIKAVTHGRGLIYGLELVESMERRGMDPCNDSLATLSVEHSKNLDLDMAERLLEKISVNLPKYIHPLNAFLVACDVMDDPERAVHIFARMKRLNIRPNIRTYEVLFSLFSNVNAPYERGNWLSRMHAFERIRHIEQDMMRNGVRHSYISLKNLIRALGAEGMITQMLHHLEMAESMLLDIEAYEMTNLYNIVLHALLEDGDVLSAVLHFKRMKSLGFLADAATYAIMIECCSLITNSRSALAWTSLMLRDGYFAGLFAYTALMKVLLANDDLDGALDLLSKASSDSIQLDVHLFNVILEHACSKICSNKDDKNSTKQLVNVMELIIGQMHQDNIEPDPSTCTYMFLAYLELGFESTAVEALRVMSLRMISQDEDDLQERRASFADLVFSEDPDVESKIVSIFKGSNEYLAVALLNLRWCTFINGYPLSWSTEESLWARRISSSYSMRNEHGFHCSPSNL